MHTVPAASQGEPGTEPPDPQQVVQAEEGARGKRAPGPGPACRQDGLTSLPDATTCPPQRAGRAVRYSKLHPCSACPPKPWEEPQQVTREGPVPHSPLWGSGALLWKRQAAEPSLSHTGPRRALSSPTCPSRDSTCGQAPKAGERQCLCRMRTLLSRAAATQEGCGHPVAALLPGHHPGLKVTPAGFWGLSWGAGSGSPQEALRTPSQHGR